MNHIGTKEISTDRLLLRKIRLEDADNMFENWASDPKVTKFLTWSAHQSVDDTRRIIELWLKDIHELNVYRWAIELKSINKVIGTIDLVNVDSRHRCGTFGYCLSASYWNQGIASEALKAMLKYLFTEGDFHRIEATHLMENPASGKVMIKCGMKVEGIKRKKFLGNDGEFHDLVLYGILKEEFMSD
jgi:[ribosomal protein S5]-alanine N-acetyltransferase